MERVPVFSQGRPVGELTAEADGLYERYQADCVLEDGMPMRLYAVYEKQELPLGIPEPEKSRLCLLRRISRKRCENGGRLLRGELRGVTQRGDSVWQEASVPGELFHSTLWKERLRQASGALTRQEDGRRYLALPYHQNRPFLLTELFCFARVVQIHGQEYAVFVFDRNENPVFYR